MDSQEPKGKQEEGKVFPGSASNGHEPFQMVAKTNNADKRPKGKVELDGLRRWEDEGGKLQTV